jgi:urease accessory protein
LRAWKLYDKELEIQRRGKQALPDTEAGKALAHLCKQTVRLEFVFRKKYFANHAYFKGKPVYPMRLTRETMELRLQTEQMGRSLVEWLRTVDAAAVADGSEPDGRIAQLAALRPAPTWPVAFALAVHRTGAPLREALLSHAFGWTENMVQAAIKAVPLGQSAGQRMLATLIATMPQAVDQAIALPDAERQAHAPMLAILSARHETQYSRLFRS